jgi:Flp pilus assembly protein TadB
MGLKFRVAIYGSKVKSPLKAGIGGDVKAVLYWAIALCAIFVSFLGGGPWFGLVVTLCFIFVPRLL